MGSSTTRIRALESGVDLGPWTALAACRGHDPEVWYPVSTHLDAPEVQTAQAVCAECPVRAECLETALALPAPEDRWGVWGGLTPRQRDRIRRDRGHCGTERGYGRHYRRGEAPCERCRTAKRGAVRDRRRAAAAEAREVGAPRVTGRQVTEEFRHGRRSR